MFISKTLGEKWKGMPDSEKEQYAEKAKLDKARYEQEMATYKPDAAN